MNGSNFEPHSLGGIDSRRMLTLIQMEVSPYCDKVRRILRYKNIPFDIQEISLLAGRSQTKTGKVPAIDVDGKRIDDSTQIAHFLEQRFPEPHLIPADPKARALCHMLEDWADESLYFYEIAVHFAFAENRASRLDALCKNESKMASPLVRPLIAKALDGIVWAQGTGRRGRERILEDVTRHADAIASLLDDGAYLIGNELTLADIAVFSQVNAMCDAPNARAIFAHHSSVLAWMDRVRTRTGG